MREYELKASFLVESLCAEVIGLQPLRTVVETIVAGGQEVQLHLQTEWLRLMDQPLLGGRTGDNINEFSEDDQTRLIARGLENLRACGASDLCAFRAGNYGADAATLRALARNGMRADTSYNVYYLGAPCELRFPSLLTQPKRYEGACEVPIAFFRDWPRHYRHVQLTACSFAEIEGALMQAWSRGWFGFVMVSHSFELLHGGHRRRGVSVADPVVIRRFEQLCRFLAEHRDKFKTTFFRDVDWDRVPETRDRRPLTSPLRRTGVRYVQQLLRRMS